MNYNCLICIDGTLDQQGEQERIQLKTRGSFLRRGNSFFITYEETETTGYAGCTTTVKVAADESRVAMLRFGPASSQLIIEKGVRHVCHYETGVGALTLGVAADEIRCQLTDAGGQAFFSYTLDDGTQELSRNLVEVTVTLD
ncbi:MAG TPA: DUF1934 domain-containing protein [Candidatus Anaerofilum excrementigallinarum]|nr:DUF1934 domain-containing protein [Candidatus Anaerofilum excrementigallinarum]